MSHRISTAVLARMTRGIPIPKSYFTGLRRRSEPQPDNILLFTRGAAELRPALESPGFHQRWVLIAALRGDGTLDLDHRPFALGAGDAILVPPLHLHSFRNLGTRLREDRLPVKEAAERAGYPDIFSFSRAFRRTPGQPPTHWRDGRAGKA